MSDPAQAAQRADTPQMKRRHALYLVLIAFAGLFIAPVFSGLAKPLFGEYEVLHMLFANLLYYLPFIALPVMLVARKCGTVQAMRPNPILLGDTLLVIAMAVLGVVLVNDLLALWAVALEKMGFTLVEAQMPVAGNTFELMISILAAAVLPGVCEELLFRGAVLPAFEKKGTRSAILITAALFTAMHGSILGMPTQFLLGLLMASAVVLTDSIYAGLIYHTVHNSALLIWEYRLRQGTDAAQAASEDMFTAIGGMQGVYALIIAVIQLGVFTALMLLLIRRRAKARGFASLPNRKQEFGAAHWMLLAALIAVAGVMYASEIILMLGG